MIEAKLDNLIGNHAYDRDPLDGELRKDGIEMIAPQRSRRRKSATQDGRRLKIDRGSASGRAILDRKIVFCRMFLPIRSLQCLKRRSLRAFAAGLLFLCSARELQSACSSEPTGTPLNIRSGTERLLYPTSSRASEKVRKLTLVKLGQGNKSAVQIRHTIGIRGEQVADRLSCLAERTQDRPIRFK
jgi:hypothetical protein